MILPNYGSQKQTMRKCLPFEKYLYVFEENVKSHPVSSENIIDIGSAAGMHLFSKEEKSKLSRVVSGVFKRMCQYPPVVKEEWDTEREFVSFLKRNFGLAIDNGQITIYSGVYGGYKTLLLFDKRKKIIVPKLVHESYKKCFRALGKEVVEVQNDSSGQINISDLNRVIDNEVSFVYVNHSQGVSPNSDYWKRLCYVAKSAGCLLLIDCDVLGVVHDNSSDPSLPLKIPSVASNSIFLFTMSKEIGMPGLRVGFGISDNQIAEKIRKFQSITLEIGGIEREIAKNVLASGLVDKKSKEIKKRMKFLVSSFKSLGWNIKSPQIGVNLFLKVPESFKKAKSCSADNLFAFFVLSKAGVLMRPGKLYGRNSGEYVRVVANQPISVLKKVFAHLKKTGVAFNMDFPKNIENEYSDTIFHVKESGENIEKLRVFKKEVKEKLVEFEKYKALERLIVKKRIKGDDVKSLEDDLKSMGDAFAFSHPLVWLLFKYERSKNKSMKWGEFIIHCDEHEKTCGKRLSFLDKYLKSRKIYVSKLSGRKSFKGVIDELSFLSSDDDLLKIWQRFEFFKMNGKPAKWQNYP